jgi:MFS family permease
MESVSGEPRFMRHDTSRAMTDNHHDDNRTGWNVARVAFVVAVFGWGLGFYGVSIYIPALSQARGWPIATVSFAVTAHYLVSALIIAQLPVLYRRFGVRHVTLAGTVLAAAGALAWSWAAAPWQLVPAVLLSGAGWSAMGGAALNAIVAPWFDKDRPRAMGFAFNGASAGGLMLTPLWAFLIERFGLGVAAAILASAAVLIVAPLAARFLGRAPKATAAKPVSPPPRPRLAILRQPAFLTISAAFALGLFAQIGLVAHLIPRLGPVFGTSIAALAISLITVCAIAGRVLLGRLIGQHDRRVAAMVNLLVQACGTGLLIVGDDPVVLLAGCVLFGLGFGNLTSLPPLLAQSEFPAAEVGTVVALVTAINQAVFAFAPGLLGLMRDLSGDYRLSFMAAAIAQVVAAAIVLTGRTPAR